MTERVGERLFITLILVGALYQVRVWEVAGGGTYFFGKC
jgi:hypothetical protein